MKRPLHGLLSPSKQEREELARQHGWEQWYHDDNWIKTEWLKKGMKVEYSGKSLDDVFFKIMEEIELDNLSKE
jgi:hypothetical protein